MGKGFKVAGLILGIFGILSATIGFFVPFLSLAGLPASIVGLVLSCVGQKREKDGLGTAALVLSIIATVFTGITFFTCGLCVICAASAAAGLGA